MAWLPCKNCKEQDLQPACPWWFCWPLVLHNLPSWCWSDVVGQCTPIYSSFFIIQINRWAPDKQTSVGANSWLVFFLVNVNDYGFFCMAVTCAKRIQTGRLCFYSFLFLMVDLSFYSEGFFLQKNLHVFNFWPKQKQKKVYLMAVFCSFSPKMNLCSYRRSTMLLKRPSFIFPQHNILETRYTNISGQKQPAYVSSHLFLWLNFFVRCCHMCTVIPDCSTLFSDISFPHGRLIFLFWKFVLHKKLHVLTFGRNKSS